MNFHVFIYIIDTSSIIDLFRNYPIDRFPRLWKNLDKLIEENRLISHKKVLEELSKKEDNAYKWIKEREKMLKDVTQKQAEIVKNILRDFPELIDYNKEEEADPWLIALALEEREQRRLATRLVIIVTEERLKGNKINIPFVCQKLEIESIDILGLMRKEDWKWD